MISSVIVDNIQLDCKRGLTQCNDYECEYRHLDVREQKIRRQHKPPHQRQHSPNQPRNCIITASRDMGRTASTWLFNAVRLVHRQAQVVGTRRRTDVVTGSLRPASDHNYVGTAPIHNKYTISQNTGLKMDRRTTLEQ